MISGVVIVRNRKPGRAVCGHLVGEAQPRERAFCRHCQVWLRAAFDESGWIADYYWRQAGPLRSLWYDICTSRGIFGYGQRKGVQSDPPDKVQWPDLEDGDVG